MTTKVLCSLNALCRCTAQRMPHQACGKWRTLLIIALLACWMLAVPRTCAQQSGASNYSTKQLMDIATQMRDEGERKGTLSNNALERHLDAVTTVAVRTKSGRAEFHASSEDEFFVVHGHATLVTGGTIVNPQGTGEIRGDSIHGGARVELKEGDVVHIPAKTPHQLLLEDDMFVYVLVKIPAA